MKRRTNLFYNSGEDSKFLTFSNYTECLTGTFLSTNIKLFPSKFICLNIPNLNKTEFINGLVAYYENKLATLRDVIVETADLKLEALQPLAYLLTYLRNNGITEIPYIGDITEQDYNGTFSDTICIINTSKMFSGTINTADVELSNEYTADDKLRGWWNDVNYFGPTAYESVNPVFDTENKYSLNDNSYITVNTTNTNTAISFNVIIPLFSTVETDVVLAAEIIDTLSPLDNSIETIIGSATIDVPMGIWFADKIITLEGDDKYNTSWSLAIGSQFKPFPSSSLITSEITNESNSIAFGSFAQILSKQNDLISYVQSENKLLQEQIDSLKIEIDNLKQLYQSR